MRQDKVIDALDRIDNDSNGPLIKCFEGLLRIYINPGHPTPKPRVGMVPTNNHLWPASLLEHLQHFCLKDRVHRFHLAEINF